MQRVADSFFNFSRVGEWPFSVLCGERLFLSVPDILTDSVAEFDSCDYERQQADNLRNVHCWTSVRIVESARPLSRWKRSAVALPPCPIRLAIASCRGGAAPHTRTQRPALIFLPIRNQRFNANQRNDLPCLTICTRARRHASSKFPKPGDPPKRNPQARPRRPGIPARLAPENIPQTRIPLLKAPKEQEQGDSFVEDVFRGQPCGDARNKDTAPTGTRFGRLPCRTSKYASRTRGSVRAGEPAGTWPRWCRRSRP